MRLFFAFSLLLAASPLVAQQQASGGITIPADQAPAQPQQQAVQAQKLDAAQPVSKPDASNLPDAPDESEPKSRIEPSKQQPKRILGIMPNFRAVSPGEIPPPPTPKRAFKIATQNSFDYSSFAFVGVTSLLAEGTNAHPSLGKGPAGFWGYYWRGFLDKTDGNYMVIFAMPTIFRQDVRYYAKGEGSIFKRGVYAARGC